MVSNGGGELPAWAARHLAESDAPALDVPPRPRARHRLGRRPTPRDPGRLRGWALATVAVAAAAGTVPLAVSALVREDPPMPQVGSFPVVDPEVLRDAGAGATSTDPALAGVLPQVVAPTAAARPLPAVAAPRRAEAPPRRTTRGGAVPTVPTVPTVSLVPTSTSPTASSTTSPTETAPRDDTGEDTEEVGAVTPREDTSTTPTTTTTTRPPSRQPPERDGLLPGLVRGVGDTAGGLLR